MPGEKPGDSDQGDLNPHTESPPPNKGAGKLRLAAEAVAAKFLPDCQSGLVRLQSRMTIRVALFPGDQRFTPRSARSRARSFEDRTLREPGSLDESPVLPCQAAISFPLTPRSVRATVQFPLHLLHATWLVPLVDRTWVLSRSGPISRPGGRRPQSLALTEAPGKVDPFLQPHAGGFIVRQNRRPSPPLVLVSTYVPLLASPAASLFYGAATIGRKGLEHGLKRS